MTEDRKSVSSTNDISQTEEISGGIDQSMPPWMLIVSVVSGLSFLIVLLIIAIFIPPSRLNPFNIFVFRVVLGLAAAAFGATISGFLTVRLELANKGVVAAGGALALFVLVFSINPPELFTNAQSTLPPAVLKQELSGIIFDQKGEPISGVLVTLPELNTKSTTNAQGAFLLEVEAEKQASVLLMAQKTGFKTYRQYATLGNTGISFKMEIANENN